MCLQEVYGAPPHLQLFDLFSHFGVLEKVKKTLPGYHCYFSPTYDVRVLGETMSYGNAILSKYPFVETETFFINGQRHTAEKFQKINVRNLQRVRVRLDDNRSFSLINHHGFWDVNPLGNEQTVEKMQRVAEVIGETERPIIFCGDLNVNPASPALRALDGLGLRNLTLDHNIVNTLSSAHRAGVEVVCDYIFSSPEIGVKNFRVSEELVSDHKALVLEFELAKVANPSKQKQELELLAN